MAAVSNQTLSNLSVTTIEDVKRYLLIPEKGNYKWTGSFESLQNVVNELCNSTTKWSSPGGGSKLFDSHEISVRWYSSNSSLTIKGTNGHNLKEQLTQIVDDSDRAEGTDKTITEKTSVENASPSEVQSMVNGLQCKINDIEASLKQEIAKIAA